MSDKPFIIVKIEGQDNQSFTIDNAMIVGRQDAREPSPLKTCVVDGVEKLVVASSNVRKLSRKIMQFTVCEDGQVEIKNLQGGQKLQLDPWKLLGPSESMRTDRPVSVVVNDNMKIRLQFNASETDDDEAEFRSISRPTPTPTPGKATEFTDNLEMTLQSVVQGMIDESVGGDSETPSDLKTAERGKLPTGEMASPTDEQKNKIIDLLKILLNVVNRRTGSEAFYRTAAQAIGDIAQLDRAEISLWEKERWVTKSTWCRNDAYTESFRNSKTLLRRAQQQRCTQVYEEAVDPSPMKSLMGITRAVASPILDEDRNVIGVLYGDRRNNQLNTKITNTQAMLVELVAGTVASQIAREREQRARQQLTQFFSSRVTEELQRDPKLLEAQDAEVTVLFCDIRRFSSESEHLGPHKTLEWINDVFTDLGDCILQNDGVLVDFMGDELLAMFGAPGHQPNHAQLACAAAIAMLNARETIRDRWDKHLHDGLDFGIGLNTGQAKVGNTGSRRRLKYGPLGHNVNLGSRIQGVSKYFHVPAIISEFTRQAIENPPETRRLGTTKVVGIEKPVNLYQLPCNPDADWKMMRDRYEQALDLMERKEYGESERQLIDLCREYPADYPSELLLKELRKQIKGQVGTQSAIFDFPK